MHEIPLSRWSEDYSATQQRLAAMREAAELYQHITTGGWRQRLTSLLTRRCWHLHDLAAVEASGKVQARHYGGTQTVLVGQIQGTEGRHREFDGAFRPLRRHDRARWLRIATAWLTGEPLPPVELVQVGEVYYVRDGHHRVSVARALGSIYIDAVVTVWNLTCTERCTSSPPGVAIHAA